jgi:hypothetical protein
VDKEGYNYLTALAKLTDQTCTNLITLIRRPGGMIPNPVGFQQPVHPYSLR